MRRWVGKANKANKGTYQATWVGRSTWNERGPHSNFFKNGFGAPIEP